MNQSGKRPRNPPASGTRGGKLPVRGRMKVVVHNGRQLYQWDQTAMQVFIEIIAPPPNASVFCNITENYVQLGAQRPGLPTAWYLNHDTGGPVIKEESYWNNGKETCKIVLTKANPGVYWRFALRDDRDDTRREQQQSKLPASRPAQRRDQGRGPVLRQQQQQRSPPTMSRPPSRGRRSERPAKQDIPNASKSSSPMRSPLAVTWRPQQKQQQQHARSPSPGRRRSRPVVVNSSTPVRAKSTSSLPTPFNSAGQRPQLQQQPTMSRSPSPGRRKSRPVKDNRPSPVKAKSMSALPSTMTGGQRQQQHMTARSPSPGPRKESPTQKDPPSNVNSTAPQRSKASRSISPVRRTRSGKEIVSISEKEKPADSFLDRFKASQEGQLQKGRHSTVSASPSRAHRKQSPSKEKSSLPVKAKPTVSFRTPPRESGKRQQKQEPRTSRSSSLARRNSKPAKDDPSSPPKARSSSFRSPLAVIQQQPDQPKQTQTKEDKSERYPTRPKSPSPERRKTEAAKKDPPSKVRSSLRGPSSSNHHPKEDYKSKSIHTGMNSNRMTGPIVQQPTEIKSIGRRAPNLSPAPGPTATEKQSATKSAYMQKLLKEKELELKSQEKLVQKLHRKISKLEDIIATSRHQDKARTKRNQSMALTADGLVEDQVNQSKPEHQRELDRLEESNRRISVKLEKQSALLKRMDKEWGKNESKMKKEARRSEIQSREIMKRESWIESLQAELEKEDKREKKEQYDQRIMAELQKQRNRVKIMRQGMKEYKRRWNEQRQFSDMQSQQIMEKHAILDLLTAKLESANRRAMEVEQERKRDELDVIDRNRVLAESQFQLEELQKEHKQALEKIWSLESELKEQVQDWNEMEGNMVEAQEQMARMSENLDPGERNQDNLTKKAIRDLIESRPEEGKAQRRINQLESQLEVQAQDWIQFEEELDVAQAKVASMEQQLSAKKLSDYTLPDAPIASMNEYLDRMAKKMMNARNQLEEVQRRRLTRSEPR
mmetsp:Transcript_7884/g.19009  ORF Transcript_7884/g.19009 Transcript_7884/m.19009 type:complete len:997 (+) Transcript_7884:155-3145(+)